MATNILKGIGIEFHILQSFPVTCLNRDDVGAPKSALVGGVPRARVSSQCWKRQVRLALHDLGLSTGIRTKRLAEMIADACLALVKARAKICPQSARKTRRSKYPVSCNTITQKGGLSRLFSLPSPSLHPLYMVAPAAAVAC